jgi:D-glycero-D-manno-heptose 1,7-bisphosphate phosphatase
MAEVIGVVADTHVPDRLNKIPSRALRLLADSEVQTILHAGDICHPSAIAQLERVATVIAVRGNRDILRPANWVLPSARTIRLGGLTVGLTHGQGTPWEYFASKLPFARRGFVPRKRLVSLAMRFDTEVQAVIYGHTHLARIDWIDGVLFFNPGSPAPEYFSDLGPTIGLLQIEGRRISPQIVQIGYRDTESERSRPALRPAVFLDRDGTLITQVHHLTDPDAVELLPGAAAALRSLHAAGYALVLITNQSVVGRGLLSEAGLADVHGELRRQLAECGVQLDGVYYSTAVPGGSDRSRIEHPDRKPGPRLLSRAARELGLDLASSWMVGDMLSDALAGRNAGCRSTILVQTGHGATVPIDHDAVDFIVDDLASAAELILSTARSVSS